MHCHEGMTEAGFFVFPFFFPRADVRPYFEAGCIDIIQPDIAHSGGISETKRIANMAETYDIAFAPHW